ncbi:MAG: molybdenum cofactor guanylyltransferase [Pirellulales bacterium]|nr:molybdenum cofactor guanylyltransferase [Pirellulales bacterium]
MPADHLTRAAGHNRRGAVVLCGGESRRMGSDKATLVVEAETLLERTVRLVGQATPLENVVVVAAPGQCLPPLPPPVSVIRDAQERQGPLPAVKAGLESLAGRVESAFAAGCDTPLLQPAVIAWLFQRLEADPAAQAVAPTDGERLFPLTAVYRTSFAARLGEAIAAGCRSLYRALDRNKAQVLTVHVDELRGIDPDLASFINCNQPPDLAAIAGKLRR